MAEQFEAFGVALLFIAVLILWGKVRSLRNQFRRLRKEVDQLHVLTDRLFLMSLNTGRTEQASRQESAVTAHRLTPFQTIGIVDGKQAFATLSQLRNIDSKRLVKKIVHVDSDILAAIKKEASQGW